MGECRASGAEHAKERKERRTTDYTDDTDHRRSDVQFISVSVCKICVIRGPSLIPYRTGSVRRDRPFGLGPSKPDPRDEVDERRLASDLAKPGVDLSAVILAVHRHLKRGVGE